METEALPDDEIKPLPVPQLRWQRMLYALVVTILPIFGFVVSFIAMPEWQSGKSSDYFALFLLPNVAIFFFPLMFYSSCCMVLLLIDPQRFAPRFVVRFGIYMGVVLALQYIIILAGTTFGMVSLISGSVLLLLYFVPAKGRHHQTKMSRTILLLLTFAGIGSLIWFYPLLPNLPVFMAACILLAGPILCFVVMAVTSVKLLKGYEVKPAFVSWAVGLVSWFAVYGLAWRLSILKAVDVYYALPKYPPDCYIATASARGHAQVVHAKPVVTINGEIWVTQQLRVLKCAEIALMALAPRFHGLLRRIYDRVGPLLARQMTNAFLADFAYLAFKPAEWAATLALKAIIPEIDVYVRRFYSRE